MCLVVEPEVVIVNLLKSDKRNYIELDDIYELCLFIKEELSKKDAQNTESIYFSVNFEAVERTVIYKNKIYNLINDRIYFKETVNDEYIKFINKNTSSVIVNLIEDYISQKAS